MQTGISVAEVAQPGFWREHLPEVFGREVFGVELWQAIAIISSVFVGLAARRILHFVATRRLRKLGGKEARGWVGNLVTTIASPGATLVVAGTLRLTYPQLDLSSRADLAMSPSYPWRGTRPRSWARAA